MFAFVFLRDGEGQAEQLSWSELDPRARAIAVRLAGEVDPGERTLLLHPAGGGADAAAR